MRSRFIQNEILVLLSDKKEHTAKEIANVLEISTKTVYTDDEEHNKLLTEGVSYFLYSKTGFPKSNGINLSGLPYDLKGNADFFMHVAAPLLVRGIAALIAG
ncbi:MAG: HTH domain-containing protein [Clostridia bacterium]|nr:HTH domain-containing protein [Clostridia bacterium]